MKFKILFCLVLLIISISSRAQNKDIRFRTISPPGGFFFQAIHSFNQDKYGYIWMGGFDGVIRYDAKEIIRYTYQPENTNGLPSNKITSIVIDNKNTIWVSTDKGLCQFNHKTQEFNRFYYTYEDGSISNDSLSSIEIDGQGQLWIADKNFFGYLDTKQNKLYRVTNGIDSSPRLLYNDESNQLWLGTLNGSVFFIDRKNTKAIKKINGPGSLARTICTSSTNIWVGYEKHGARLYDLDGNLVKHYSYSTNSDFDIKTTSVRKIWRDTRGQIWIGSYLGLFRSVGNNITHFDHEEYEGLPHNSIFDIFEDKQGGIWIGTWSGGIAYMHHSDNKFSNYRHSKETGSISDNMVSSFAQLPNGELFVGTELFGLNQLDLKSSNFSQIDLLRTKTIVNIKAMEVDDYGGLWIASAFNGVFMRPNGSSKIIHFPPGEEDGKHVSVSGVYALCKSDSGMWIGTSFGGMNFYSFKTKKISFLNSEQPFNVLKDLNIRSLSIDSNKNIWATTSMGLFCFNLPSGNSTQFSIHSKNKYKTRRESFYFARELSDGKIWIGTEGDGINIYDPNSDSLEFFDANGFLKGKDVYGIIEGRNGNIWITSNNGLILYNKGNSISRKFVITDGIQGNLFNPNSIFKDIEGNLYFGGTNGFSRLEPKPIKTNYRKPNIFLNRIVVNNRKIVPVQTGIGEFEKIVLAPTETTVNFNFSADNFLLPDKNEFKYRLTNYVDEWIETGNSGTAGFVNLPSGEYNFEVKACNNDGVWNETPASITIVIAKSWYKTSVALILYSIILFIIILLIIRFYVERSKLKKALLIEKMEHQQEEQLHEMKLKFFTNISHEFRTPLTLINGPVKQLLNDENLSAPQHKQLNTVKRNTQRLLQLINQIMDLRKAEKGLEKLSISNVELVDFINERILNFSEESRSKNISLTFNYNESTSYIEADEEKLDKIIYNLLSNAFKYTPVNGNIVVTLDGEKNNHNNSYSNQLSFGELKKEQFVEFSVQDDGEGINGEDLPNIFERFKHGKTSNSSSYSTGIGLNLCKDFTLMHRGTIVVQSTVGRGTRFSIQLPAKQKAQKILYQSHEEVKNIESWESVSQLDSKSVNGTGGVSILVVEDNKDLRDYIIGLINKDYNVLPAENGKRGLEILKTNNIELVISDVMMPLMDGFEFCQTLKSQFETSHIPVILLTALSSVENTTIGLDKGADAYISKPFEEKVLLSQINNLLVQRKRLKENYARNFISKQPIEVGTLDNFFLNKINAIVEKNLVNENFSVDILADEICLSRSQLHRKLKQISNHSASEYINMVKIKKATTLLASKNYNVDEVAFKVGFNSHSYFTKCFKKIHGLTPKEYLKGVSG